MKTKLLYIFVGLLLSSFAFFSPNWELKKDKDGIKVYTATKEGSSYRQCKSTVSIKTSVQSVCDYLLNPNNFKKHSERISKIKVLKTTSKSAIYYMSVDLPWPATDRDGIYQIDLISKSTDEAVLKIKPLPNLMDEVKDHIRIKVSDTKYVLKKNGDKIDVTMYVHTEPEGSVPAWLANYYVEDSPFEVLTAVRKDLQK